MTPALTNALAALASRLTASGDYEAVDVIDTASARIARLEEALWHLLIAVEYKGPSVDFGKPGDPNWCFEARIPVGFVDIARAALGSDAV